MGRLTRSIGRFFNGVINLITLRFIWASKKIEDNPEVVGLEYDEIIRGKAGAAQRVKNAVGGLIANQEQWGARLASLTDEIENLEQEKAGAQALAEGRVKALRAQGMSDANILKDPEVMQYQAAFADCASTIEEKRARAQDLEKQIQDIQGTVEEYVVQLQNMQRDLQQLRAERHEAVADMQISLQFDSINEALAGISTEGTENRLVELRRRRSEARGKARASSRLAGTDVSLQRQKLREAARQRVGNREFLNAIGINQAAQAEAPKEASSERVGPEREGKLPE
jgi:phage shock protein A